MQGYVFLEHGKSCSVCINLILIGKTTVDGANIRLKAVERFKLHLSQFLENFCFPRVSYRIILCFLDVS